MFSNPKSHTQLKVSTVQIVIDTDSYTSFMLNHHVLCAFQTWRWKLFSVCEMVIVICLSCWRISPFEKDIKVIILRILLQYTVKSLWSTVYVPCTLYFWNQTEMFSHQIILIIDRLLMFGRTQYNVSYSLSYLFLLGFEKYKFSIYICNEYMRL